MTAAGILPILLLLLLGIAAFVLFVAFVLVPVFRGVGWIIASVFTAIGFLCSHIFEFIGGMIGDALRFIGAIIPVFILAPLALGNVVIGRWSAAGHFAESVKRECMVAGACLYRFFIRRPLKLFWLHGMLEGVEERMPEAVYGAPTSDQPSSRTGQFEGYTIVGSLRSGGSGGKLYIARPDERKQRRLVGFPDHVVIKSFALTEGSSLPQIVRESRALECAKQLGHVLDHGMDEHRFFYVMPYHPGDHLGIITRQLHGESGGEGLGRRQLAQATGYIRDLIATLSHYHKGGLWHKDVKPENIIVHDGRAHLVDLGLVTPLKSAMTLTTHGTEYFRDPEMVRQALRGVKVHQVNGAKFDIYAAGAVLYFMLENTFPAHGGLSRFSQKSPEALRWIVRRAMTEYNQRYDSADLMLADLQFVLASSDPFAIKPAELPSMRGGASVVTADDEFMDEQDEQQYPLTTPKSTPSSRWVKHFPYRRHQVSSARSAIRLAHVLVSPDSKEHDRQEALRTYERSIKSDRSLSSADRDAHIEWATKNLHNVQGWNTFLRWAVPSVAFVEAQERATTVAHAATPMPPRRPNLRVTNWWTGEYAVDDGERPGSRSDPAIGATIGEVRRTAREQIAAARARARELRARAKAHRHKVGIDRQPSAALGLIIIVTLLGLVGLMFFMNSASQRSNARHVATIMEQTNASLAQATEHATRSQRDLHRFTKSLSLDLPPLPHLPLLLINDHPAKNDPVVQERVKRITNEYLVAGRMIAVHELDAEAAIRRLLPGRSEDVEMTELLAAELESRGLGGILYIDIRPGDGPAQERIRVRELAAPAFAGVE